MRIPIQIESVMARDRISNTLYVGASKSGKKCSSSVRVVFERGVREFHLYIDL